MLTDLQRKACVSRISHGEDAAEVALDGVDLLRTLRGSLRGKPLPRKKTAAFGLLGRS